MPHSFLPDCQSDTESLYGFPDVGSLLDKKEGGYPTGSQPPLLQVSAKILIPILAVGCSIFK